MACPFFFPTQRHERELWACRARLPLGDGWTGRCAAPGHDGALPSDDELRDGCNLGYASACPRLPREREADAVHFSVAADRGGIISLRYALERDHAPAGHGCLEYDRSAARWSGPPPDSRLQALARSYLQAYLARRPRSNGAEG